MNLFQWGSFKLRSGRTSRLKIDCDALTPADWKALSELALSFLPPVSRVEGVPTGGIALATFLSAATKPHGKLLIVDDVFTSGDSMEQQRAGREAIGVVVIARREPPDWITPLFWMGHDV